MWAWLAGSPGSIEVTCAAMWSCGSSICFGERNGKKGTCSTNHRVLVEQTKNLKYNFLSCFAAKRKFFGYPRFPIFILVLSFFTGTEFLNGNSVPVITSREHPWLILYPKILKWQIVPSKCFCSSLRRFWFWFWEDWWFWSWTKPSVFVGHLKALNQANAGLTLTRPHSDLWPLAPDSSLLYEAGSPCGGREASVVLRRVWLW